MIQYVRGYTHQKDKGNTIDISKKLVQMFESAKPEDKDALLWWVVKTLLHEEVHRGDLQKNGEPEGEPGNDFDNEMWSPTVDGQVSVYLDWPGFGDVDFEQKMIDRAREVRAEKSKTEEGRKMLPSLIGNAAAQQINAALDANPSIVLIVTNL
ncbi:Metallopeptidase toxin 3 [Chitinophaga sp. CF118]|uniref:hypothetical protein n=1 Tax=Chitinophaga sp. CF118 TaxID=1884367 RepID=UPI0008E6002C|nr:hypothetical protein [Chitinophaga sp. CF118]SFD26107.1 Metallopeptidase toxin 3 [Chitinophaga sp. CF118]